MFQLPEGETREDYKVKGIYKIRCLIDNIEYVGSSEYIYERMQQHENTYRNESKIENKRTRTKLISHLLKYGIDKFIFSKIAIVNDVRLLKCIETLFQLKLDTLSNGLNTNYACCDCKGYYYIFRDYVIRNINRASLTEEEEKSIKLGYYDVRMTQYMYKIALNDNK